MTSKISLSTIAIAVVVVLSLIAIANYIKVYVDESNCFNNGICRICKKPLKLIKVFPYKRMYRCTLCRYDIIIHINRVDDKYRNIFKPWKGSR